MNFSHTLVPESRRIPESMRVSSRLKAFAAAAKEAEQAVSVDAHSALGTPLPAKPPAVASASSLRRLARSIVGAADQNGQTPILVPGSRVRLEPDFFVALSGELIDLARRPIRIEALSPAAGGWAAIRFLPKHRRTVRLLAEAVPYDVTVVEINRISRPAGLKRPLFVGLATSNGLLRWLPTASCFRMILLEAGTRTPLPADTQAGVERFHLKAIHGGGNRAAAANRTVQKP